MPPEKEPMIFRPGSGPTPVIEVRSVRDLVDSGIHIYPGVVEEIFGPDALVEYQRMEAERAAARNRAVEQEIRQQRHSGF